MEGRDAYRPAPRRVPAPVSRRAFLRLGFTPQARADIDYDGVTAAVRATWEDPARAPLLRALEPVAQVAVDLAGVAAGARVLDAGAGDGNVALLCAARGAEVDACDIAAAAVERGRERAAAAATAAPVRWRVADVQALPYADGAFDVVISAFGAALAPRARRAAAELARVLRPGGRLVLTAWVPRGLPGRLDEHLALPDGVAAPTAWADEATARRRFEPHLDGIERRTRTVPLAFPDPGAMAAALGVAAPLRPAFDRLLAAQNNRPPAAEVDARYVVYAGDRRASARAAILSDRSCPR
jgi:SAM-dependent methyltransferase